MANDAEGVWSPDIEQSFQEALAIYPPCGRRKIILSDEGKMYGRNELIARYIKLRTGKTRSRKQVSSHIQVLARKKAREIQSKLKEFVTARPQDQAARDKALQTMASMSSAQIVSASLLQNKALGVPSFDGFNSQQQQQQAQAQYFQSTQPAVSYSATTVTQASYGNAIQPSVIQGSAVTASSVIPPSSGAVGINPQVSDLPLRLIEFSGYLEQQRLDPDSYHKHLFVHLGPNTNWSDPLLEAVDIRQIYDKFPEKGGLKELYDNGPQNVFFLVKFWADLNTNVQDETGAFYGVSCTYESTQEMAITVSTKVCSFGKQVVEKVETEYGHYENGRFVYRIHRSPMCEYMINFIHKLKQLPEKYMMNSVLENFTILQVVTNRESQETLLCFAYVFEVSTSEHGAQHHIYRLVKD